MGQPAANELVGPIYANSQSQASPSTVGGARARDEAASDSQLMVYTYRCKQPESEVSGQEEQQQHQQSRTDVACVQDPRERGESGGLGTVSGDHWGQTKQPAWEERGKKNRITGASCDRPHP